MVISKESTADRRQLTELFLTRLTISNKTHTQVKQIATLIIITDQDPYLFIPTSIIYTCDDFNLIHFGSMLESPG